VLEYLRDGNATHAYIRAGYSRRGAQPSASRLLRQPHIDAAIAAGQQRIADALEVSVERLGREYAKITFASVDDFVSVEDDGRLRVDLEKASRAQREGILELKLSNHSKPEQTVTLKLGKLQALAALTKHVGLFAKRPEPKPAPVDSARYEKVIAKLGEELWETKELLCDAAEERDEAQAALATAHAALAAAGLDPPTQDPDVPPSLGECQGPSAAPDLRGEKEDNSNPCAIDPPQAAPEEPPPHVAGAGNGTILRNATRQPPSGPTWHDIIRNSRFPGQ